MDTAGIPVDVILARADSEVGSRVRELDDGERRRADGYRVAEARETFILSRVLLRRELATRLGCRPAEVAFDLRASGKPDVRRMDDRLADWRFSLSHTGPLVALAFARGVDLGIDIERSDRAVDPLSIAKRYFTPEEHASLEAAPAEQRLQWFYAGWTRKEAIVKARGSTMAESLTTLSVDLDPGSRSPGYADAEVASHRARCRITAFEVAAFALVGAVAVVSDQAPLLRFDIRSALRFD